MVVALAVTRAGLPVRSWVFPGNPTDVATVERIKADLRGWKLGRALFVADAGMHSEANREELARGVGKYVLAVPMGAITEVKTEVLSRPGRATAQSRITCSAQRGDRRRWGAPSALHRLLQSQRGRAPSEASWPEVIEALQEELARHKSRQATAKWAMELLTSGRYSRATSRSRAAKCV